MPMPASQLEALITSAFPDAKITLEDLAGDNDHWRATVISAAFRGKSRPQQHKMVYEALGPHMGTTLHALSLQTAAE